MGVVYQARQKSLNRTVALKVILAGVHARETDRVRFRAEAEAIARLQHPHIVQIYEVGEHDGLPFFSLEYCPGGSLEQTLGGTPFPVGRAAGLVEILARALHAAHQKGILHRDLKPANVLLAEDGTPRITDFGLAKKLDEVGPTTSGAVVGTPSYMAPEQAAGKRRELGPPTDVYALGALLYECLTGRPPFRAATALDTILQVLNDDPVPPTRLQPKVPRDLETICLKCLEKEPQRRYATALALAEDLRRFQAGEPIVARTQGPLERTWRWGRRNRAAAAAVLFLIGGVVASTGLAIWALANAAQAEVREQQVRREQGKTRAALAAEARRRRQALQALDALGDDVIEEFMARRQELDPAQRAFLEKVLSLQQEIARDLGEDPESVHRVADGHLRVGQIQQRLGRLTEAEQAYRAALALYERLERETPDSPLLRARQASAWNNLGNVLREAGRPREAEQALQRSLQLTGKGTESGANPSGSSRPLAALKARMNQALTRELNGELDAAVAGYREVLAGLADVENAPAAGETELALLAQCRSNLGSALNTQRRNGEAAEQLGKAVTTFRLLGRHFPREPGHRSGLAKALHNLASAREGLGELPEAEKLFREAAEVEQQVVREYPGVPEYQADLANHLDRLASLLRRSNRRNEAEPLYRKAVAAAARAAKDRPASAELRELAASGQENLACLLAELSRFAEAEPLMREALAARRGLARDLASNPLYALRWTGSRLNLVRMLGVQGKEQEALAEINDVVRTLEEMAARQPGLPGAGPLLSESLQIGDWVYADVRRLPEAAEELQRQATQGQLSESVLYLAARLQARASAAMKDDKPRAEKYAQQALAALQRAQRAGYFRDPARKQALLQETDLSALRGRSEFKSLLAEIEKP
jgi:serine/threonine-protein kinase